MPVVEFRRIISPAADEGSISYRGQPLSALPKFKQTRFSSTFLYTDERVVANVLLASLRTLDLGVVAIDPDNESDFKVTLDDGNPILIEVKTIRTRELYVTQQIQDLSAGLSEWAYNTPEVAQRLNDVQLTFVIPEFEIDSELDAAWEELQRFLTNADLSSHSDHLVPITESYRTLAALRSRILVRRATPSFVQVTQGARAVGSPALGNFELFQQLELFRTQAAKRTPHAQWLLVWFQSLYNPFSVDAASQVLEDIDIAPYERLIVADGRNLAIIAPD